jgi:hypothetical protein
MNDKKVLIVEVYELFTDFLKYVVVVRRVMHAAQEAGLLEHQWKPFVAEFYPQLVELEVRATQIDPKFQSGTLFLPGWWKKQGIDWDLSCEVRSHLWSCDPEDLVKADKDIIPIDQIMRKKRGM